MRRDRHGFYIDERYWPWPPPGELRCRGLDEHEWRNRRCRARPDCVVMLESSYGPGLVPCCVMHLAYLHSHAKGISGYYALASGGRWTFAKDSGPYPPVGENDPTYEGTMFLELQRRFLERYPVTKFPPACLHERRGELYSCSEETKQRATWTDLSEHRILPPATIRYESLPWRLRFLWASHFQNDDR